MTEDSARRLVYAVLAQEYRAHRSLWIGTLCLALGAAMISGLVVDGASSLRNAASIVIVLGALYLMVLLVLRQELSARSAGLPPDEAIAFRKGLTSGLLRACAPAVLAIIVCSTALLVLGSIAPRDGRRLSPPVREPHAEESEPCPPTASSSPVSPRRAAPAAL